MSSLATFSGAGLQGVRFMRKKQIIKGVPRIAGTHTKEAYWVFRQLSVELAAGDALVMVSRDPDRTSAALRVWANLLPLDEGDVVRPARSLLVTSPQPRWVRELSVEQTIRMLAGLYGLTDDETETVVGPAAKTAQVESVLHWPMENLGKGSRDQIAFAVAVQAPVDVVMFDHTGLVGSPEFRPLCAGHLKSLRESGKGVVIVTAKPQVALETGTGAVIVRGKRADVVTVAEAAEFLIRDRVKGRRKARRRAREEDDDDGGLGF